MPRFMPGRRTLVYMTEEALPGRFVRRRHKIQFIFV